MDLRDGLGDMIPITRIPLSFLRTGQMGAISSGRFRVARYLVGRNPTSARAGQQDHLRFAFANASADIIGSIEARLAKFR